MVVMLMPNPLAKRILNNIADRGIKPSSPSNTCRDVRLTEREEALLSSIINGDRGDLNRQQLPQIVNAKKAITLEALAERVKGS